jgi:hypothetical protein
MNRQHLNAFLAEHRENPPNPPLLSGQGRIHEIERIEV